MRSIKWALASILLAFAACNKETPKPAAATNAGQSDITKQETYPATGVVQELLPSGKSVKIRHDEIPGYMKAMTMDFDVKNIDELKGLAPGDVVAFRLVVTETDGWIENVTKLGKKAIQPPPGVQIVRNVEPLKVGDFIPDYQFTNELGKSVTLSQFRGKALAVTFIFTTCPFPTFCPRMSHNFTEIQNRLMEMSNTPTNWHLLSISIDPETDTPAVLKSYAERYGYNPDHWSFLTGNTTEIATFADQLGLKFAREGGTINHNLRTAVIDANGRIQSIYVANEWKSGELMENLIKAASP